MSGQLWIGSGFGDERLGNAGAELGCSDLPGWSEAQAHKKIKEVIEKGKKDGGGKKKHAKRAKMEEDGVGGLGAGFGGSREREKGDGTDDYLHPVISPNLPTDTTGKNRILDPSASHADIQSLQESAEIAGKVVLLQRGGCGFLEKVLWAQRRGGIAVIVGDDVPNRPLIQMYARGDTGNVTVPSVFTSRNTARMLSSLYGEGMQPGRGDEDRHKQRPKEKKPQAQPTERSAGWFGRLLSGGSADGVAEVDINDLDISDQIGGSASAKSVKPPSNSNSKQKAGAKSDDGFVIGVQDWRDPDLVKKPGAPEVPLRGAGSKKPAGNGKEVKKEAQPLPAADYGPKKINNKAAAKTVVVNPPNAAAAVAAHSDLKMPAPPVEEKSGNLLTKFFGDDRDLSATTKGDNTDEDLDDSPIPMPPVHEGVWVTLMQTNGATPFFDTLLVLVVSPLVTLTVVYAMLLIRSRIRRRRWRAPKSVVQQLPVRTFIARDTRNDSNASQVSQAGRSTSPCPGGEATPLLGRPRSRTTSGLPEPGLSRTNSSTGLLDEPKPLNANAMRNSSKGRKDGGGKAAGSQWKKYMGRQVECVVCLEEYVDGVSRVMSLPCGHEFHVECM